MDSKALSTATNSHSIKMMPDRGQRGEGAVDEEK